MWLLIQLLLLLLFFGRKYTALVASRQRQQRTTSIFQRYKRHTREVSGNFRANLKLFLVALYFPELRWQRQQSWVYDSDSLRSKKSLACEKEGENCLQHQVLVVYWAQFSLLGCCANCSPTLPRRLGEEVSGKGYQLHCIASNFEGNSSQSCQFFK